MQDPPLHPMLILLNRMSILLFTDQPAEILERGVLSETSDSDEHGIECIGAGQGLSVDDMVFTANLDSDP